MVRLTDFEDSGQIVPELACTLDSLVLGRCPHLTNVSMSCLALLPNLLVLHIPGASVNTAGMREVARNLPWLQSLNLAYCSGIKDLSFVTCLQRLRLLNISNCGGWSNQSIELVSRLRELRVLRIRDSSRIADAALCFLSRLRTLELLDLSGCSKISDRGLCSICQLPRLTSLAVSDCCITDEGLESITALADRLCTLSISRCMNLSTEGIGYLLGKLSRCAQLDLKGMPAVQHSSIEQLQAGVLESVTLSDCVDLVALAPLGARLVSLELPGSALCDQALSRVSALCPTIQVLDLSYNQRPLGHAAMCAIGELSQLRALMLIGCELSDELADDEVWTHHTWTRLQLLQQLNLSYALGCTDQLLQQLVGSVGGHLVSLCVAGLQLEHGKGLFSDSGAYWHLPQLQQLDLSDNMLLTDASLAVVALSNATTLRTLNITGCTNLTSSVLKPFGTAHRLSGLSICHCIQIGDDALPAIACCTQLVELSTSGSGVSDAALAELIQLPEMRSLKVAWEQQGWDGVGNWFGNTQQHSPSTSPSLRPNSSNKHRKKKQRRRNLVF